jgi:hypothetical protein
LHNKEFINQILGDQYDLQICTAVEIRNFWGVFNKDKQLRRFFYEIAHERLLIECFKEMGEEFFRLHKKAFKLNIKENQITLINMSCSAIETECIIGYTNGYFDMSIEEICDFEIKTIYEFMNISHNRINEILNISKEIYSKINVRLKKYFELELVKD